MREITIKQLAATKFKPLYFRFLAGEDLEERDLVKLLAISVLLLNHESPELKRLGYRIVLFYGNMTGNYEALYDVAINSGLLPVSAIIEEANYDSTNSDSFLRNFIGSYIDTFRDQGIVLTEQQDALRNFVAEEYQNSIAVIAPTSYGKSELIIKSVRENPDKRILILVPSKALLAQTKKRLIDADIAELGKVITHPEMYSNEKDCRAFVLTQERLARLLSEQPNLSFDMVFVDEAHNLLNGDHRNELLASVICMLGNRHQGASFKFLTPFLCDELNLRIRYLDMPIKGFKINEYIKSERFYLRDFRTGKSDTAFKMYDHFLNNWIIVNRQYETGYDLVIGESLSKNIIYANKPKSIERFAQELAKRLPEIDCPLVARACQELEESFDRRYNLISCLRRGVMYHHGSIPDTVRLYLEDLFSRSKSLKYLACSSTLLEGVNLPIERLFLIDNRKGASKLTSSQLKNLVGRVNRFSEVFSSKGGQALRKLESSIYLLGIDGFTSKRANLTTYYSDTVNVSKKDRDSLNNVLLEATDVSNSDIKEKFTAAIERLENLQNGLISERECRYVTTQVGKLLIANSVNEINVFRNESRIKLRIDNFLASRGRIGTADDLMDALKTCFIDFLDDDREYSELLRLKQVPARRFYAMMLDWRLKKLSVRRIIGRFIQYWDTRDSRESGDYVYVSRWGDTKYLQSHFEHWVQISTKNTREKINLAIVRIKEEEDFFDYKIFRFVEILNSLEALETSFYKKIKYGTTSPTKINLIREGFSRGLAELLLEKYRDLVHRSEQGDLVVSNKLIQRMVANDESDLLIFEARMNVKS